MVLLRVRIDVRKALKAAERPFETDFFYGVKGRYEVEDIGSVADEGKNLGRQGRESRRGTRLQILDSKKRVELVGISVVIGSFWKLGVAIDMSSPDVGNIGRIRLPKFCVLFSSVVPQAVTKVISFDGRAWRALVAGYDPPMSTMDGVSVLKSEVEWTDVEEQASVGNFKAWNAIFTGVDLNIIMKEFLEIANESLLLGEKIPESKIMRKVLCSLPGKFDMKVTAIEEAHDITKLKLDELFGSLLTFEMAISHKENKKGKGVAFKSIYEDESMGDQVNDETQMNESIALLTKQFSKMVKKFKNLNTTDSSAQNPTNYRRKNDENYTRRPNVPLLRRQKKTFHATLLDEETGDSEEDNSMNAFTICITETDSEDGSEGFGETCDKTLTFEELKNPMERRF
ncbi:gag-pol polyprotein [Cucumis melo var. makuwa]|uniref:Gag-pol polyprotein n=1 Tax=Cucumis melo var. makuwa TaxID=1194695 RepID=A0A5A7T054_CUCMM|nr:gag-pol polyprotein [Cucumis melo var. makuwa]TYK21312.1 gag-pol polyprotein [Cucumis melo var. makuwa]